jgi:MFS family permease
MSGTNLLRALAHRNFRLFFFGQAVSLVGTFMQQVALSWVVYDLARTDKLARGLAPPAFWLGLVAFAGQVPTFFIAPVAGVLVDRHNRHRLVILTQSLAMVQASLLALLTLTGAVAIWHVVALSLALGVIYAVDMTARQAFLTDMVERREDLANAIALNSSMVNGSRLVGPALAGLMLTLTNAGVCFLANALSYLAVLVALLAMRVTPRRREGEARPLLHDLAEGARYAFGFPPTRAVLLLLALVSVMASAYTVLLPVFATEVLGGGAGTFSLLTASSAVGALGAGISLASRRSVLGLGKWVALSAGLFGLGLLAFAFSRLTWLSLALMAVTGFAMMTQMAASNTILQTIVEEDKRGRLMSFYTVAFLGAAPLGSLLAGTLTAPLGAENVVRLAGACCVAGALVFLAQLPTLRALVRPIYARMGILPEAASGVQAASELTVPPGRQ